MEGYFIQLTSQPEVYFKKLHMFITVMFPYLNYLYCLKLM